MGTKQNCSHVRLAYQLMEANKGRFSVETMCRVLEVAPSRYYAWLKKPISEREREDARLLRLIRASFDRGHGIYGAPRVFLDLREAGEICSKHRVERLMRENGLRAHGGFRIRRVVAGKAAVLIPNLLQRQFTDRGRRAGDERGRHRWALRLPLRPADPTPFRGGSHGAALAGLLQHQRGNRPDAGGDQASCKLGWRGE